MKTYNLHDFQGGWFVGFFPASIIPGCTGFEVAVKHYKAGDTDKAHVHRVAREITVIVKGLVELGGLKYRDGDIFVLEPGEAMPGDFKALWNTTTVCVKTPSVPNDKFAL